MMNSDDYYIYHVGMPRRSGRYKWGSGKRPFQSLKASAQKKAKAYAADQKAKFDKARQNRAEVKYYSKLRKKDVSKLTNEEITQLKKRYEHENSLLNVERTVKSYNTGKKTVKGFLGDSVKQAAKPAIVKSGTYAINKIIKDSAGIKEPIDWANFADFVAPVKENKKDKKDKNEDKKDGS